MLSKQLRGAATELCRLNVLENRTKLRVFLRGIGQLSGHETLFRRRAGRGKRERELIKVMRSSKNIYGGVKIRREAHINVFRCNEYSDPFSVY